jgi:tetratricopeptide (TPR) repeat protein
MPVRFRFMSESHQSNGVRCWQQEVVLPTYPVPPADPNPMFIEKRVYQGSSGKVYPNPFTDHVSLERKDVSYRAILLENEFIQLMILPEIGGRIHTGLDKTNQYDFFYRQRVIKPALVGLLGPWISGGVEFNWPQHHRPSTYMPVHSFIEHGDDGSATVWLSEHEPMNRMRGMVGISLSPGKALVEAKVRLYNRTPLPQSFLWWANAAVHVHDRYQAFFPPDVDFVADHARRAISSFPLARGTYYGVDYSPRTDISWYKNIPVPTSYMVTESKYDFMGGYDHACQAGMVHICDHHIAPGKKVWTWGNAEFGHAWDRNLTDEDGPYMELMSGVFTDNQPDFSWLQPFETRTFSQYWYPIQKIGPAKNANAEAALNLEFNQDNASLGVCVTSQRTVRVSFTRNGRVIFDERVELAPGEPFVSAIETSGGSPTEYRLIVRDADERELISYQPDALQDTVLPAAATAPLPPAEIASVDELYLTGLHLEQYRHATRSPEIYWREGLSRDPEDSRLNNAMGLAHLRRGLFAEAEKHFARAVRRLTSRNMNPRDGEPFYNFGLACRYQSRNPEAYDAFFKSVWNYAWQSVGFYALASINTEWGHLPAALDHAERSLESNGQNLKARALKAALLRKMNRSEEAEDLIEDSLAVDSLDFRMMAERVLLRRDSATVREYLFALEGDVQTLLDVGYDLAWCGMRDDALFLLEACGREQRWEQEHPMLWYTLSWLASLLGKEQESGQYLELAEGASPLYCFPARCEEMIVLEDCLRRNSKSARAHYYLGNLYYDKHRYQEAIECWRRSVELDSQFSIPFRNLGIAEFNILRNPEAADGMYARAFAADPQDARLLYEWDQLKKRAHVASPEERLLTLRDHWALVERRDDLYIEFVTLQNHCGQWHQALEKLQARQFSPWEGGEGLVSAQYVLAHREIGREALAAGKAREALEHFEAARHYPHNLGEGKHLLTLERDLDYYSGLATLKLGDLDTARCYWSAAAVPLPALGIQSYFQALALRELGNDESACALLTDLAEFAARKMKTDPEIDYFATSLPNMLLFEDDLKERNTAACLLLMAYAQLGLGDIDKARSLFQQILQIDSNSLEARVEPRHLNEVAVDRG